MLRPLTAAVVGAAVVFDFINGFHDTANAVATSVSTRVLSPMRAVGMAAVLNFVGALISTEVAKTVGRGIVAPSAVTQSVILAALLGAITWNLITWYWGIPSSSSHALVGGVIGAAAAYEGFAILNVSGLIHIFSSLLVSPAVGFVVGLTLMVALFWLFRAAVPARINAHFRRLQVLSAAFVAFSHGTNDAQKSMGIITMALVTGGYLGSFVVPWWVKLVCALAMALGTAAGGWKIIQTMGMRIIKLQPIHGFAAETSSALVIQTASHFGLPVSTTHVISSAIMGVGASKRLSAVRWGVATNIVIAWIVTPPVSAILGGLAYFVISAWA
ncbi:MAG: inorganic phosphate transporter [Armatimonadota bacterium]|nr:MAG: inorganic phosphate transporter [Armatimonadota bacterium]